MRESEALILTGATVTKFSIIVVSAISFMSLAAFAQEFQIGNLQMLDPTIRATPPKAPVSGGYLIIRNNGAEDDVLIGASADFAGKVEVHEMKMEGDVMTMREIGGGLVIPAGEEVVLKPGGLHIMFMDLKEQMKADETRKATLVFEKAGPIEIEFGIAKPDSGRDHSGH